MNKYETLVDACILLVIIIVYFAWFKKCIDGAGEVNKDDRDF